MTIFNNYLLCFLSASGTVGGIKNDGGWKDNISRIAEAHPGSPIAQRYGKDTTKNINTRNVLKKHKFCDLMAKKQDVKIDDLVTIKPITDNQKVAFEAFKKDNKELFLHGRWNWKDFYFFVPCT